MGRARVVVVAALALTASLALTGCAWSGAAGAATLLFLALALLAGCGGKAVVEDVPGTPGSDAGSDAPGDAAIDSEGDAGIDAPDTYVPPTTEAGVPDASAPDCGGGYCPSGMTCVQTNNGPWCMPDADMDDLVDDEDNCPFAQNLSQSDADGDNVGDACDLCDGPNDQISCGVNCCSDPDGDGIAGVDVYLSYTSESDNCPYVPNPYQEDGDQDGVGDACDFCPDEFNPLTPCGDPCLDSDGDGIPDLNYCGGDTVDPCPFTPSEHMGDADQDGIWDVCDPDGIPPLVPDDSGSTAMREDRSGVRLAMRRAILARLARQGVLDRATVCAASGV